MPCSKANIFRSSDIMYNGGETGIRTLGTITSTTVFETAPIDHSGISPHVTRAWSLPENPAYPDGRAGPLTDVFRFAKRKVDLDDD